MSNIPKFGPVYHLNNQHIPEKTRTSPIIQSPKKSALHPSPMIPAPLNKNMSPGIVYTPKQQNCINPIDKALSTPNKSLLPHKTLTRSQSLSLNTLEKPLDSLDQSIPKKTGRKRHRNSCSADISWSPNLALFQKDDVIKRKKSNLSDDNGSLLCSQDMDEK